MPPVRLLFGPMLIGTFFNAILYGVMVVQMLVYYQAYKKDRTWIKLFVLFLFVIETINTACDIAMMYEPLVLEYGTPHATTFFPLLLPADPLLTVIISTSVQVFIAWRIRVISRATWLAIIICILAIISLGGGIWLTVTIVLVHTYARKPELHWPALTWLLASAIDDVIITVSLAVHLVCNTKSRRKTGFSRTDDALNRIIRLTIQTGFITAVFAVLDITCFLALPHTTINFIWDFSLSKLYTNTLLSTLNARSAWGNLIHEPMSHSVLFGSSREGPRSEEYKTTDLRTPQIVSTEAYEMPRLASSGDTTKKFSTIEYGISVSKEVDTVFDPVVSNV